MPSLQAQAQAVADSYAKPATGRPSMIGDAAQVQELIQAIADGNYIDTAAEIAGIPRSTLYGWLKRADTLEEPYKSFSDTVKRAQAKAEALAVARVRKAGEDPRFWAAEMTFLERRHPDRWARRSEDSHTPKVVVQIGVKDSDVQVQIHTQHAEPPSSLSSPVSMSLSEPMQPLALSDSTD